MSFVKCHFMTLGVIECQRQLLYPCTGNLVSLYWPIFSSAHTRLQCCFLPKRRLQPPALYYLWEWTVLSRCIVLNDSLRLEINSGKYNSADRAALSCLLFSQFCYAFVWGTKSSGDVTGWLWHCKNGHFTLPYKGKNAV